MKPTPYFITSFVVTLYLVISCSAVFLCKGVEPQQSDDLVRVTRSCLPDMKEENEDSNEDLIYAGKICIWKNSNFTVIKDGKMDFEKLKEMMTVHLFNGNNVGRVVMQRVQEQCGDKVRNVNVETDRGKGKEFVTCMTDTMKKECESQ